MHPSSPGATGTRSGVTAVPPPALAPPGVGRGHDPFLLFFGGFKAKKWGFLYLPYAYGLLKHARGVKWSCTRGRGCSNAAPEASGPNLRWFLVLQTGAGSLHSLAAFSARQGGGRCGSEAPGFHKCSRATRDASQQSKGPGD